MYGHSDSGAVTERYYPQGEQINGKNRYYVTDKLGSVMQVVNANGSLLGESRYDAYGKRELAVGTQPRYCGLNVYGYVGGDPINLVDKYGLWGFFSGFGGGWYVGAGGEAYSGGYWSVDTGRSGAYTSSGHGAGYDASVGVTMGIFFGEGSPVAIHGGKSTTILY